MAQSNARLPTAFGMYNPQIRYAEMQFCLMLLLWEKGCAFFTLAASNILYRLAQPRIAWRACALGADVDNCDRSLHTCENERAKVSRLEK